MIPIFEALSVLVDWRQLFWTRFVAWIEVMAAASVFWKLDIQLACFIIELDSVKKLLVVGDIQEADNVCVCVVACIERPEVLRAG